jgi:DNA polymerase III alpha subunit (gram-positive type)
MIIKHWSKEFRAQYGNEFPTDYTCFDTETSGFNRKKDLIIEWGHCIVRDRKVTDKINIAINWFGSGLLGPNTDEWVERRLLEVARNISVNAGRTTHLTARYLREKGVPVDEALPWIHEILCTLTDQGEMLVSHNGWNYDVAILQNHFRDFVGDDFVFPDNQMFDTGAIEKASQVEDDINFRPAPGETMREYFSRVAYRPAKGIKWNLDLCVEKYRLVERHGVPANATHQAGHDAWLLHFLMEEFRELADKDGEPSLPVVQDAERAPTKQTKRKPTKQGLAPTDRKRRRGQRKR